MDSYQQFSKQIVDCFDLMELQDLSYTLDVYWEELRGGNISEKVLSLILHLANRNQIKDLIAILKEERQMFDWPNEQTIEQIISTLRTSPSSRVSDDTLQEVLQVYYPEIWSEIIRKDLHQVRLNLGQLTNQIRGCFNESEFNDLCFFLGIPEGALGGASYYDQARELVKYTSRQGTIAELLKYCNDKRPNFTWHGYDK
jgi:hypothetical protein